MEKILLRCLVMRKKKIFSYEKIPLVVLIGRPNVGKSTLFNCILGYRKAIVCHEPGTTRDNILGEGGWQGKKFWLIDTAGVDGELQKTNIGKVVASRFEEILEEADLLLWIVDGKAGINKEDRRIYGLLKNHLNKTFMVVNKVDNVVEGHYSGEFDNFGYHSRYILSARNSRGVGDLLDGIVKHVEVKKDHSIQSKKELRVSVIGRPNVGKSTLVNCLCGYERMITDNKPGTTRDIGEVRIKLKDDYFWLVDVAGIRSRGKTVDKVDWYSQIRALEAIRQTDLVVMVVDASERLNSRDLAILSLLEEAEKAVVIFANKMDLSEDSEVTKKLLRDVIRMRTGFGWLPIIFGSAKECRGIKGLKSKVLETGNKYQSVVDSEALKYFLKNVLMLNPKLNDLAIRSIFQIASAPPKFNIICGKKNPACLQERLIKRLIREQFGLEGVLIGLVWNKKNKNVY